MDEKKRIVIRDRRTPYQFSVHNIVIDEWFPLIGPYGFALYALYCRMAGKDDERSYPSIRMIKKHYRMSTSTISDHNKLLGWCGLIHVESGGANSPNEYYVLNVPKATPERLAGVREAVHADQERKAADREEKAQELEAGGLPEKAAALRQAQRHAQRQAQQPDEFAQTVLRRLDKWSPVSTHWKKRKKRRLEVVRPGQLALLDVDQPVLAVDQGDPLPEHADPAHEQADLAHKQSDLAPEQGDPTHGEGVREATPNNPKEQSKQTAKKNNKNRTSSTSTAAAAAGVPLPEQQNDDDDDDGQREVVRMILAWMGFDGRLSHQDKNPSALLILSWALWVKLRGDAAKNPVGVARAGWRRGEFPETPLIDYAKEVSPLVLATRPADVGQVLDGLAVAFELPSLEDQIPVAYRDVIKR